MTEPESHFTVFIRLPFDRGSFIDPPPVSWTASKEKALWDVISRQARNDEVDWRALAEKFEVTQPFLLQQAAWLYERQLSQVRAQMRRMGNRLSTPSSPAPGSISASMVGGQAMKRAGSGGSRVPSRLSTQAVGSPAIGSTIESTVPGTPGKSRPSISSRTPSTNPATQGRLPAPQLPTSRPISRQTSKETEPPTQAYIATGATHSRRGSLQHAISRSPGPPRGLAVQLPDSESDDAQANKPTSTTRRHAPPTVHRRSTSRKESTSSRPAVTPNKRVTSEIKAEEKHRANEDDDDEDSPSFLPFATTPSTTKTLTNAKTETRRQSYGYSQQDSSATLRGGLGINPSPITTRPGLPRRKTSERIVSPASNQEPNPTPSTRPGLPPQLLTSSTSSLSSSHPSASGPMSPIPISATSTSTTTVGVGASSSVTTTKTLTGPSSPQSHNSTPTTTLPTTKIPSSNRNNFNNPQSAATPIIPTLTQTTRDLRNQARTQRSINQALAQTPIPPTQPSIPSPTQNPIVTGYSPLHRPNHLPHQQGHISSGPDTSPSMGSSFSDLDDASVTQSALEEALMSANLGTTVGTMGGTTFSATSTGMGTGTGTPGGGRTQQQQQQQGPPSTGRVGGIGGIGQALRSRYFDARQ